MGTTTITTNESQSANAPMTSPWLIRLMHLVSPSLPTGGFAYSQGLEWAIEKGWINSEAPLEQWLLNVIETGMTHVDIPLLQIIYQAVERQDLDAFTRAVQWVRACRETKELRDEEAHRGRAMAAIIKELGLCHAGMANAAKNQTMTHGTKLYPHPNWPGLPLPQRYGKSQFRLQHKGICGPGLKIRCWPP